MKKILLASTALLFLTACDTKITSEGNEAREIVPQQRRSANIGFGMSYSGRPGVHIGHGLVLTSKGLRFGFGF